MALLAVGAATTPTRSATRLVEHIELTVLAVGFGLLIALPLALLSVRYRRLYGPVLAITGILYTIPSLALFALLLPAHRPVAHHRADPAHRATRCSSWCGTPSPASTACPPT